MTGKVVDAAGAAIPDATISLTDLSTNKVLHATTGQDGQFSITDVPPDPQLITIEKEGTQSFTQRISLATQPSAMLMPR